MHYQSVAALLFTFAVSLSYSQLWKGNQTVSPDHPWNATWRTFHLQKTATLHMSSNHRNCSVCIVYKAYMLPKWTEYNEENCLFYKNGTMAGKDEEPWELFLLEAEYQIGVYLSYPTGEKDDNSTVFLTLDGLECPDTEYYDGTGCVASTEVKGTGINETVQGGHFTPGTTKFWTYVSGPGLSYLSFRMVNSTLKTEETEIRARYLGGTFSADDAKDVNGMVNLVAPRQGLWVFSVKLLGGGTEGMANFTLDEHACGDSSAGVGCTIKVDQPSNNMNVTLEANTWMYLRFVVDEKHPLLVSVTTPNGTLVPNLYAMNGQIPVGNATGFVHADIRNCNRDYCSVVRSIVRNITKATADDPSETWYIGIISGVTMTFGVWWNNTCVPDCDTDNHGECEDSGRCQCEIDFEGINCAHSKGLGPQYIVLIIIASLVVASAIIGFVAWAYMRRKRANYEIVS